MINVEDERLRMALNPIGIANKEKPISMQKMWHGGSDLHKTKMA